MTGKVLLHDVHVTEEDNTVTILKAGTSVPKSLAKHVTNPKAYAPDKATEDSGDSAEDAGDGDSDEGTGEGYAGFDKDGLIAELKKRELPVGGNKTELIERLEFDDLEREDAGDGDSDEGTEENKE